MAGTVIKRVGILGSGIMGAGLAEVAAKAGCEVIVRSRQRATADALLAGLGRSLDRQVEKGKLDDRTRAEILGRVVATDHLRSLVECDLVIESVVEDLPIKKALFAELEQVVQPDAIFATNTSTFPVVELAVQTERPERVCGLHFFNPAPLMRLVEIVRPLTASDDTVDALRAFALSCDKEPVVVADRAGFVVNALLFPYLNDAVRMLEASYATADDIDHAMKLGCGYPAGPFELLDEIGPEVVLAGLRALHRETPEPGLAPAPLLEQLVTAGRRFRS